MLTTPTTKASQPDASAQLVAPSARFSFRAETIADLKASARRISASTNSSSCTGPTVCGTSGSSPCECCCGN